jgi:MSHA biogenesis protein MshL
MTDLAFFRHFSVTRMPGFARKTSCAALSVALLSGCGLPLVKHGELDKRLQKDLARATAERKAAEAIDPALMPPLQIVQPALPAEAETRFDLSVVGAPATQVFMALVSGTRYSMLLPKDLTGSITVNLKDVTLKETLDTLRELYGYEYRIDGTRVFVQSNALQSRVFHINYLAGRREGASDLRVTGSSSSMGGSTNTSGSSSSGSGSSSSSSSSSSSGAQASRGSGGKGSETSRVSTTSDADFWRELNSALKVLVGEADGRSVIVNPLSGVVVVRAMANEMRSVEKYLNATQLVAERQVMLEAKIISVTLNNGAQSGINWSVFNTVKKNGRTMFGVMGPNASLKTTEGQAIGSGTALTVTPGKFGEAVSSGLTNGFVGLAFQTANFAGLLSFLETQGDVAVLSSPRIATLNNQKAVLKVGSDDMFVVNVKGGTASTSNATGTSPEVDLRSFFSGISLDVTPQIDDEGNIILHVHPAISQVTEVEKVVDLGTNGGVFRLPLPSAEINESDSIVRVQNGSIVAIGGLMKQTQSQNRSQLPGAGDSGLSYLFGQRNASASKTEMVILIKPTIIDKDTAWQNDLQGVRDRLPEMSRYKSAVSVAK